MILIQAAIAFLTTFILAQPDEYSFSTHGMIMVLDDSELWAPNTNPLNKNPNYSFASTYTFLQALVGENSPIIVTKRTYVILRLLLLCAEYCKTKNEAFLQEIEQAINQMPYALSAFRMDKTSWKSLEDNIGEAIQNLDAYHQSRKLPDTFIIVFKGQVNTNYGFQLILTAYYNFQTSDWLVRDIGSNLVLLVPKKIYKESNDKKLGLLVNSFKEIAHIKLSDLIQEATADHFDLENTLANVFVPVDQYKDNEPVPSWSIYMHGHGGLGRYFTMKPEEIFALLKNLNKKINLKLLALNTCSLKQEITDEFQKIMQTTFITKGYNQIPGIYAFGGIVEHYTRTILMVSLGEIVRSDSKLNITFANFEEFFKDLQSSDTINFENTLNKVFLYNLSSKFYPENIPLIRFPSNDFFTPLQAPSLIASIGSVMTASRDPQKPLNLNTFFKKSQLTQVCPALPKLLLLYTPEVPFYLKIKKCNAEFPLLLSMINKPTVRLKGLILEDFTPNAIIEALKKQFAINEQNKIYFIDEILIQKSALPGQQPSLEKIMEHVVMVKGTMSQWGYYPGIYYANSFSQSQIELLYKNNKWETSVYAHNAYDFLLGKFKDAAPLIGPITHEMAQRINISLIKKKTFLLKELFQEFSTDLRVLATLL